jgi:hypothetical protein
MIKLLKILIVIIFLSAAVFFGFRYFQKYSESQGILEARIYPPQATLEINNKTYQNKKGIFNIRLNPGEHAISFSCPDYSFFEDKIKIESNKTTSLENVYLFPNNWPEEKIITNEKIEGFYLSPDSNRIIYIEKSSNYEWYIFDRNTKEKEYFYKTSSLPYDVVFSQKKILINSGKNNWEIVFLPKSLIKDTISLNTSLKRILDQTKLREKDPSLTIDQAIFYEKNEGDIIIKSPDAIYVLNFLKESIERIYEGKSSRFIYSDDHIYFIKENGVLSKISLNTKEEVETSLYSFAIENLEKAKIRKKENEDNFLIIEGSEKAYYMNAFENIPKLISENVIDGLFSLNGKEILISLKDKIEIYNTESEIKYSEKLYSDLPATWFLNDNYILFLNNNLLNIYSLKNNKIWPIASDIKNNNFFYDQSINYIFYLSNLGIIKVSL